MARLACPSRDRGTSGLTRAPARRMRVATCARRGGPRKWWETRETPGIESELIQQPEYFDLRRAERSRAREGQRETEVYESRLNQRLRSSVASSAPPYGAFDDEDEDETSSQNRGLLTKIGQAWRIFFPPKKRNLENMPARAAAKSRLSMILVADRNSLSSEVMEDMKSTIVNALEDYLELGSQRDIELSMKSKTGKDETVYNVSVPVKCVKPEKRSYFSPDGIIEDNDGEALMTQDNWDEWDEDPKSRFPWGT